MGFVAKSWTLFYTRFDTLLILCVLKHNRLQFKGKKEDLLLGIKLGNENKIQIYIEYKFEDLCCS